MRLYIGYGHIMSSTGVQQGKPLWPLLFSLALPTLIHQTIDSCKLFLHARYLDDENFVWDSEEVVKALDIIRDSRP